MKLTHLLLIIVFVFHLQSGKAQLLPDPQKQSNKEQIKFYEYCIDSLQNKKLFIYLVDKGSYTGLSLKHIKQQTLEIVSPVKTIRKPFLQVHGNVLYDVVYHSNIDTPYNEKNIYQHTVQTYLDITIKDKYPFRVYFTNRFSNSSLFKNFNDFNLLYTNNIFNQNIKEQIKQKLAEVLKKAGNIELTRALLDRKIKELNLLQNQVNNPAILQRKVEEREKLLFKKAGNNTGDFDNPATEIFKNKKLSGFEEKLKDSLKSTGISDSSKIKKPEYSLPVADSLKYSGSFLEQYENKIKQIDSLRAEITRLENKYQSEKQAGKTGINLAMRDIDKIGNSRQLQERLKSLNIPDSILPKGFKTWMDIRSFGIGRNLVDYSELSVKNISITGVQAEYNPSYYVAFASGFVDYRFRDYVISGATNKRQYLNVVRIGQGQKEGNNLIFTYYTGTKQLYNYNTADPVVHTPSDYRLMGITLENRYQINENNFIVAEIAKSSLPFYNRSQSKESVWASTFKFKDRSNEAYSLKLAFFFPSTKTKINGFYKHFGANFQSYSLFTTSSSQSAWSLKVDQPFFKRKLMVTGSIKANDFTNPYLNRNYTSSTVFKSIQATLRIKKLPVVSLGYFPSSQLTRLSEDQYLENLFYTLVGNASHFYRYRKLMMNTVVSYTRFYNKQADTNFVYFNTKNILVSQTVFLNKLTLTLNLSGAVNNEYSLYMAEQQLQYKLKNWLTVGGGLKYNRQTVFNKEQLGFNANTIFKLRKLGELQFIWDRGFIPGTDKQLVENNIGRFTYYRTF